MAIKIRKHGDRALFLQQHVGDAEQGDIKIQLGTCIATGSLVALLKNEKTGARAAYTLPMRSFVEEVLAVEAGESECAKKEDNG